MVTRVCLETGATAYDLISFRTIMPRSTIPYLETDPEYQVLQQ